MVEVFIHGPSVFYGVIGAIMTILATIAIVCICATGTIYYDD